MFCSMCTISTCKCIVVSAPTNMSAGQIACSTCMHHQCRNDRPINLQCGCILSHHQFTGGVRTRSWPWPWKCQKVRTGRAPCLLLAQRVAACLPERQRPASTCYIAPSLQQCALSVHLRQTMGTSPAESPVWRGSACCVTSTMMHNASCSSTLCRVVRTASMQSQLVAPSVVLETHYSQNVHETSHGRHPWRPQ